MHCIIMILGYLFIERHWVAFGWLISTPEGKGESVIVKLLEKLY